MKNTLVGGLVLLLSMLLWSCSDSDDEKEPYFVSLSEEYLQAEDVGMDFHITVESNCEWVVQEDEEWISTYTYEPETLYVKVEKNMGVDSREGTIFFLDPDGNVAAKITVFQMEGKRIEPYRQEKAISYKGGELEVTVATNTEITGINCPDWIVRNESRALSDSTYYFTVLPNISDNAREGTISFVTGRGSSFCHVKQGKCFDLSDIKVSVDGLNPYEASLLAEPNELYGASGEWEYAVTWEPEFLDTSLLTAKSSEDFLTASIMDGKLILDFHGKGDGFVSIYYKETCLWTGHIINYSTDFSLTTGYGGIFLIGNTLRIETNLKPGMFTLSSSDDNIAYVISDDQVYLNNEGEAVITATSNITGKQLPINITVRKMRACVFANHYSEGDNREYYVRFTAKVEAYLPFKVTGVMIFDKEGFLVCNANAQEGENSKQAELGCDAYIVWDASYRNISDQISEYKAVIHYTMNGIAGSMTVPVDPSFLKWR